MFQRLTKILFVGFYFNLSPICRSQLQGHTFTWHHKRWRTSKCHCTVHGELWHFPLSLLSWCSVSMPVTARFRSGSQGDDKVWPYGGSACALSCWLRSQTNGGCLKKTSWSENSQTQFNAKCTSRAWMCLFICVLCVNVLKGWICAAVRVSVYAHAMMCHHISVCTAVCCLKWLWHGPVSWITADLCTYVTNFTQLESIKILP